MTNPDPSVSRCSNQPAFGSTPLCVSGEKGRGVVGVVCSVWCACVSVERESGGWWAACVLKHD